MHNHKKIIGLEKDLEYIMQELDELLQKEIKKAFLSNGEKLEIDTQFIKGYMHYCPHPETNKLGLWVKNDCFPLCNMAISDLQLIYHYLITKENGNNNAKK